VAGHNITPAVADVGERFSCNYRRTHQMTLKAGSPAEFPMSVVCIHRPRLVQVVVQLACVGCQHAYEPDLADFETGHTGCPRCGGWTWIAELGTAGAQVGEVGGDGP
jgi:hypothetical protein